jgi:hypothetical protein
VLAAAAGASIVGALTRLVTCSRTLFGWDSVNFALALDRLDLVRHQPHPPASIGYVLAGRVLRLLVADANLALVAWNVLLTAVSGVLVFALAFHASSRARQTHGWLAWAALMASPLLWFYGSVAEVYLSETTLGLLVALCCVRALDGDRHYAYAAVAALAVLGSFRLSSLALLLPLVAFACWRTRASYARAAGLLGVCVATWLVPLLLQQGAATYLSVLADQSAWAATAASVFSGASARNLNRHLRDLAYALIQGLGPVNALALPCVLLCFRPRLLPRGDLVVVVGLWTLPTLAFYALVHMAKPGYVLLAVPALALASAFYLGGLRRGWQIALVAGQLLGGAGFFLAAKPAHGTLAGDGRLYRQKSFAQKLVTEASSLTSATRHAIVQADEDLVRVLEELERACPTQAGAVLIGGEGPGANWRRLMYYAPRALSIRLPGEGGGAWYRAQQRAFAVSQDNRLDVSEQCRTFWVLPAASPLLGQLRAAGALQETRERVYWTASTAVVELGGGFQLAIRHTGP